LNKIEWYIDNDLTDKCLIVDIVYVRDEIGFAVSRTTTRTWVNNDESLNIYQKITFKDYTINDGESSSEGKSRRGALVDNIEIPTMRAMHEALVPEGWSSVDIVMSGRRFLDEYESTFSKFIKNSSTYTNKSSPHYGRKKVVVKIEEEDDIEFSLWLDAIIFSFDGLTIREFLMGEFQV
jgi:hypothetical protein